MLTFRRDKVYVTNFYCKTYTVSCFILDIWILDQSNVYNKMMPFSNLCAFYEKEALIFTMDDTP